MSNSTSLRQHILNRTNELGPDRQAVLLVNAKEIIALTFDVDDLEELSEEQMGIAKKLCNILIDAVIVVRSVRRKQQ